MLLPLTAVLCALVMLSAPVGPFTPSSAAAATTTTDVHSSCRDGGGVTWKTKLRWGSAYRDSDAKTRISVSAASWTTTRSGKVPADVVVRTYDGSGTVIQTLKHKASTNYKSGRLYLSRNPRNPVSAPGAVKVVMTLGVAGDGKASCSVTFTQPSSTSKPISPPRPPSSSRNDSSPGWLSGASSRQAADGSYGTWRGSDVEIVGFWVDDPALYPIGAKISGCPDCGAARDFRGPIDMAVAPPSWSSWANEANGEHDAFWTAVFRNAKKLRDGKGTTFVRPWYEYNGNWFPYSVRPGEEAAFKRAFARVNAIQDREFPAAKLMLGTSAGGPVSVASTWPSSGVDVLNIDFYNNWPFCTTTACFNNKIENGAGDSSLEDLRRLAKSKGVPVAIGEWSNQGQRQSASSGGGGESPQFIRDWNGWLRKNAGTAPGEVLYEIQFNLWPDQFELFTSAHKSTPTQPKTAEEYRRLW